MRGSSLTADSSAIACVRSSCSDAPACGSSVEEPSGTLLQADRKARRAMPLSLFMFEQPAAARECANESTAALSVTEVAAYQVRAVQVAHRVKEEARADTARARAQEAEDQ